MTDIADARITIAAIALGVGLAAFVTALFVVQALMVEGPDFVQGSGP